MKRIAMTDAAEYDCFSRWRKWLCYLDRPGVKKSIRRGYNKRFRKAAKAEARRLAAN